MKKNIISCMARLLIAICVGNCFASQDVKRVGNDFVRGDLNLSSGAPQVEYSSVLQDALTIDSALLEAAEEEWRKEEEARKQNEESGDRVRSRRWEEASNPEEVRRQESYVEEMKTKYLLANRSLIKALTGVDSRRFRKAQKLSECIGGWNFFKDRDPFEYPLSTSEDRDAKYTDLLLKTEEFLRSSIIYCQAILGSNKGYCLKEFCNIIEAEHLAESAWLNISPDDLSSVRRIFLEFFYGIKCMEYASLWVSRNSIIPSKTDIDFFDGIEKPIREIAFKYLSMSKRPVVRSIFEVEDSLLIAGMLRRNKELKDQAKRTTDDKGYDDNYLNNLIEVARDTQLAKLANALDWHYNTCYMDNGVSWMFVGINKRLYTPIGLMVLSVWKSLVRLSKDIYKRAMSPQTSPALQKNHNRLIEQYRSLTRYLGFLLICAQRTLNLGSIRLSLDDFITLLKHLNARSDGGWLSKALCKRLVRLINEIEGAVECLKLCDYCAGILNLSLDAECCSKLLLDRSGNPIKYQDMLDRRYFDTLKEFEKKVSSLETSMLEPCSRSSRVPPSALLEPQENMLLTPEDFYNICNELEHNIAVGRSTQEAAPGRLPARSESEPSALLGVQSEPTTQEVASKRKPDERGDGREQKSRRLNPLPGQS